MVFVYEPHLCAAGSKILKSIFCNKMQNKFRPNTLEKFWFVFFCILDIDHGSCAQAPTIQRFFQQHFWCLAACDFLQNFWLSTRPKDTQSHKLACFVLSPSNFQVLAIWNNFCIFTRAFYPVFFKAERNDTTDTSFLIRPSWIWFMLQRTLVSCALQTFLLQIAAQKHWKVETALRQVIHWQLAQVPDHWREKVSVSGYMHWHHWCDRVSYEV